MSSTSNNHNNNSNKYPARFTDDEVQQLLEKCDEQISAATALLEEASDVCGKMGETISSELATINHAATTAGYSNTDHVVVMTKDYETDRIAELRKNMLNRMRARQPESRGEHRWDKPRMPGERRRRLVRDQDTPEAPPEPPVAGYIVFVGQMTTKIRHDRPNVPHNQTAVVQEISKLWRIALSDDDREFYTRFSEEARKEYDMMHLEYRATGSFRPSRKFQRLEGVGPWIHAEPMDRNSLEHEIAGYNTVQFRPRPPEFDEAYERRMRESIRRRKLKLKGLLNPDGTERCEPLPSVRPKRRRSRRKVDRDGDKKDGKEHADVEGQHEVQEQQYEVQEQQQDVQEEQQENQEPAAVEEQQQDVPEDQQENQEPAAVDNHIGGAMVCLNEC